MEVDPETGKRKPSGGKGSGTPTLAPGLDACLLCGDDSDPDVCLSPLPKADEDDENPEDLVALSRQGLFDTGAARSVCPSTFRPDVPIEPSEEIPSGGRHKGGTLRLQVPQRVCWHSQDRRQVGREKM